MKRIFWTLLFLYLTGAGLAQNKDYPIQVIPFTQVKFTDKFWLPRIKTNHTVTIPASFERCENTGRVKNFDMAAAKSGKFCTVYPFDDTDIYKTIEGAAFSLSLYPDKKMESYIDSIIVIIGKAQEPDGYLYTARTINPNDPHKWAGKERWEKEREQSHELYNAGHLYEAAAAYYQATRKRNLLDIALKNADLVCSVFGKDKKHVAPGHEVIEMGLVKLYRITAKKEYLETAKYFIEERGHFSGYDKLNKDPYKNGAYWQDHKPVVEQTEAIGHAVRAGYLYSGMADVAALTGDVGFLKAVDTIWNNVVTKKIYVQGGIGAVGDGERFGDNYELPNGTAYNETCAAIANVYWNHRMFLLHGDSRYMDILEKSLYNGLISGVGMDGKSFFYTNAMQIKNGFKHNDKESSRSGWFTCSCCPTNVVRLIPSIPGYVYAMKGKDLYVNLFVTSNLSVTIEKKQVLISQENDYPWEGNLVFKVSPSSAVEFNLLVRIPGWAENKAMPSDLYRFSDTSDKKVEIKINGKPVVYQIEKGYAVLNKKWQKGDRVEVLLPMEIRKVVANRQVEDDRNKIALQRGPLMYCAEWPDNHGKTSNIIIPMNTSFTAQFKPDLLNGVTTLEGTALTVVIGDDGKNISTKQQSCVVIPYYSWAHRGEGEMMVWFPDKVVDVDLIADEPAKK